MGPENNDILELTVFRALDRHGEVAPSVPKPEVRLSAESFPNKLGDLCRGEVVLSAHSTQTIHTCNRMRNRCLHAHGGKCGAELTVVGGIRQCEVGQNSKLPVSLVSASTAVQR